jgi:hypothetical protein
MDEYTSAFEFFKELICVCIIENADLYVLGGEFLWSVI